MSFTEKSKNIVIQKNKNLGTALITGGAKRIGREIALNLAEMGYDLVIGFNKSQAEAKKLSQEIKKNFAVRCEIYQCDLCDLNQTKKLARFVKENFPGWNLLVNNASIFSESKFLSGSDFELFQNLNIHLVSPLILAKEFAKNPAKNSHIINMIDKNITRFETKYFYYLLSKKFLTELTKMLAVEIAPEVRVNGIAPGFILNSVDEKNPSAETQNLIKKIPLKTKGEVENIWQAIEFLLRNNFVNGQIIFVDGGASLNHAG